MTTKLTTSELRDQLAEVVNRAAYGKERVILTRRGKPLAAIIPIEDIRLLEELENQRDLAEAREGMAEAAKEGTLSWEESKRRRRMIAE
ncbi:MAG TPA: type II toxin-antitoxin system prevent-host-death family antitoxin [Chloroflexota bacterium]|jgi:prevent-host-death family protein|nr:type II toxin-antitoxin system prevent-host-death family antitoxin [Chloroflexota bacterium]